MGPQEIKEFLTWLAVERNVAAATQNQALNALVFLYDKVLGISIGDISDVTRAKRPPRLPVVLTHDKAMRLIAELAAPYDLMASLMYGGGGPACRNRQTRRLPHPPAHLCDRTAQARQRYPHGAGTPWSRRYPHNADLHTRSGPGFRRGEQSTWVNVDGGQYGAMYRVL